MNIDELKNQYYQFDNSYDRYLLLTEYLSEYPEDNTGKEMLSVLNLRYGNAKLRKPADHFMHACMMMKVMADEKFSTFSLTKNKQEYQKLLKELGLYKSQTVELLAEWKHFAKMYIRLGKENQSRSYFFGMGKREDIVVEQRVNEEFQKVFIDLPNRLGFTKQIEVLKDIIQYELNHM